MRAKVILSVLFLALVVLIPAIYFHYKSDSTASLLQPETTNDSVNTAPTPLPPILKRVAQDHSREERERLPVGLPTVRFAGSDRDNYILERKAELTDLAMSDNPANLKTILSELENPEPEIRQAALSATIEFRSKDAIPQLQMEMNWATDPEEKVAIKKAIEFLELPGFGSGGSITQSADGSPPATN
jgi:HEAT repeat protein